MQLLRLKGFNQNDAVIAVTVHRVLRRRRRGQYWLKPLIARRPQFRDFENVMVKLETESRGDFVGYLRM